MTGDRATLRVARESLEFLEEMCFDGDRLQLVGNTGWHSPGGEKASADEQAIDAAAFVLAFRCAYSVTAGHGTICAACASRSRGSSARTAWACRCTISPPAAAATGMGMAQVNQNQGAESTICFLMSLLEMLELAGEGIEHAGTETCARRTMKSHPDHTHAASPLAGRAPRAGQAVPAGRRDAAAGRIARDTC